MSIANAEHRSNNGTGSNIPESEQDTTAVYTRAHDKSTIHALSPAFHMPRTEVYTRITALKVQYSTRWNANSTATHITR